MPAFHVLYVRFSLQIYYCPLSENLLSHIFMIRWVAGLSVPRIKDTSTYASRKTYIVNCSHFETYVAHILPVPLKPFGIICVYVCATLYQRFYHVSPLLFSSSCLKDIRNRFSFFHGCFDYFLWTKQFETLCTDVMSHAEHDLLSIFLR